MPPSGLYIFLSDATKILLINRLNLGPLGRTIQASARWRVREESHFKMALLPNHTLLIFGTFEHLCHHLLITAVLRVCTARHCWSPERPLRVEQRG